MNEDTYLSLDAQKVILFLSPLHPYLYYLPYNVDLTSTTLPLKTMLTLELTKVGGEIIEKIYEPLTFAQMIDFFSKKYLEDKKKVRENIVNFLSQLKKFGISTISYKEKKIENKLEKLGSWEFIVPREMELEITNNCNFHCKHCYNHSGERENLLELSKE